MLLAITAMEQEMTSQMDPRFGRAKNIMFFDSESFELKEVVENPNFDASGSAGIKTTELIIDRGTDIIISGHVGPNAMTAIKGGGIKLYKSEIKSINEVLDDYKAGKLELITE